MSAFSTTPSLISAVRTLPNSAGTKESAMLKTASQPVNDLGRARPRHSAVPRRLRSVARITGFPRPVRFDGA